MTALTQPRPCTIHMADDDNLLVAIHTLSVTGNFRALREVLRPMTESKRAVTALRYSCYVQTTYGMCFTVRFFLKLWGDLISPDPWEDA